MILTPRAKAKPIKTLVKRRAHNTSSSWPDGAANVKAKKSVKNGQVLFEDEYNILQGNENSELSILQPIKGRRLG